MKTSESWVILYFYPFFSFEDVKMVLGSNKLKKGRQYNGEKKKDKTTNNNLHFTIQKTKDWATLTQNE